MSSAVHNAGMRPGTIVLLHSPLTTADAWGELPGRLRTHGLAVLVPRITDDESPPYAARYVARAALEINAAAPATPLLLVAHSGAGPLLPAIGAAQRAAHRLVGGYVFLDAGLPQGGSPNRLDRLEAEMPEALPPLRELFAAGGVYPDWDPPAGLEGTLRPRGEAFFTEALPTAPDWPDAPGGYLRTSDAYDAAARQAELRGWPVLRRDLGHFPGHEHPAETTSALLDLIDRI
ncbi:MAG: hypothetical protein GEV11_01675 [Streptosporangiales bacterium]|nr:hypothetical protein [Streptosporangiales bacterium]